MRLPAASTLAPDIVLIAVFYWTVHRPDLMRLWTVFVIGLLSDVLSGTPLGVHPLVLVLVHAAIISQHKMFRGAVVRRWCGGLLADRAGGAPRGCGGRVPCLRRACPSCRCSCCGWC